MHQSKPHFFHAFCARGVLVFASYGGLGGHGFESRVADLESDPRVEGFGGGFAGGLRSQAGSRANEVVPFRNTSEPHLYG